MAIPEDSWGLDGDDLCFSEEPGPSGEPCPSLSTPPPTPSPRLYLSPRSPSRSVPSPSPVSSFKEFTPDITADKPNETFRLRCSRPGLYLCSVTGLVFHVGGDRGEVAYRIVPWDQRLLARHHKKAAGPLFDIRCEQRSVLGLQLPHCEILSGGGGDFLSVAHLEDDAVEFLRPKGVTETHVLVDVSGLSAFGNVNDEDFPPQPVRALVLLFYRPPDDPDDPESLLNVLMLPRNVVLREVQRIRKKLVGPERYIETPSQCKLHPDRDYVLSTSPQDDQILVEPTEAEFYCDNYDNYVPSFQVILETRLNHITLLLKEGDGSLCVWERRVPLIVRASGGPSAPDLVHSERLLEVRTGFVEGISGPALKSLLDRLLEKKVITDAEGEAAEATPNHRDRARFVIDIVRKKGEDASLEMIEFLKEADPFLCEHLGLF
ncbi:uncharacterized protein ACO6RY_13062 [Pungitius sinensis]